MRLVVTTPTSVVEDVDHIRHVRAEDVTGAFGILPGHADLVTVLPVSVVTWRDENDREGFVLVRGGVLAVREGERVEIAARGAYRDDELAKLSDEALERLRSADEAEEESRTSDARLHLATMRMVDRVLRAGRDGDRPPMLRRTPEVSDDGVGGP